jgi:hypothetical protein
MWQENAQSHHQYVEIAGRHHRDRLSRATVGVERCGTSMSAVHQPVLTLVRTAHGNSPIGATAIVEGIRLLTHDKMIVKAGLVLLAA